MSKRSISTTTSMVSNANRSHNHHLPTPTSVATATTNQRIPGILSVTGLDLRGNGGTGRKGGQRQTASTSVQNGMKKTKQPRGRDGIPSSVSLPVGLEQASATLKGRGNVKTPAQMEDDTREEFPDFSVGSRFTRGRRKRGSLSSAFPKVDESSNDPFLDSSSAIAAPTATTAALEHSVKLTEGKDDSSPNITPSTSNTSARRRTPKSKSKLKPKGDRSNIHTKERRKENKHSRSVMKERVADVAVSSDSAAEDMIVDLDDAPQPSVTPALASDSSAMPVATTPRTPPPKSITAHGPPSPSNPNRPHSATPATLGASAPISVPKPPVSHSNSPSPLSVPATAPAGNGGMNSNSYRFRVQSHGIKGGARMNAASMPSTPPRASSIQPSSSAKTLPHPTIHTNSNPNFGTGANSNANASHSHHTRTHSHPTFPSAFPSQFSASAPSSPSAPQLFNGYVFPGTVNANGGRYANSKFQHSPSPNVLPKPKFLESVFMEVDEGL